MYKVHYYLNGECLTYNIEFNTIASAFYKARAIYTEHGIGSDVMDKDTGEILAIFSRKEFYISHDLMEKICICPLYEI